MVIIYEMNTNILDKYIFCHVCFSIFLLHITMVATWIAIILIIKV
jgi:hypothetical protein